MCDTKVVSVASAIETSGKEPCTHDMHAEWLHAFRSAMTAPIKCVDAIICTSCQHASGRSLHRLSVTFYVSLLARSLNHFDASDSLLRLCVVRYSVVQGQRFCRQKTSSQCAHCKHDRATNALTSQCRMPWNDFTLTDSNG